MIPKISAYDTQFTTKGTDGKTQHIPVPADTNLIINVIGLHYNSQFTLNYSLCRGFLTLPRHSQLLEGPTRIQTGALPGGIREIRMASLFCGTSSMHRPEVSDQPPKH